MKTVLLIASLVCLVPPVTGAHGHTTAHQRCPGACAV